MTDPAQNPPADPLKALEEALKSSKGNEPSAAQSVDTPSVPAPASAPPAPTAPPDPASEETAKQAELAALEQQHLATDAQEIQVQIQNLRQLTDNAPQHESEAPVAPTPEQTSDADGFAIHQITHQKTQG